MPTHAGWVLLILLALVPMHGAQVMALDGAGEPTAVAHGQSEGASMPFKTQAADGRPAFDSSEPGVPTGHPVTPGAPAHGTVAHLWALCLAVLLAGITLLGLAVLRRRRHHDAYPGRVSTSRWVRGWIRAPRPPDLFSLCLLRT